MGSVLCEHRKGIHPTFKGFNDANVSCKLEQNAF